MHPRRMSRNHHDGPGHATVIVAVVWLLMACGAACAADTAPLVLEHLTTAEGLPQGTVFVTLQDSRASCGWRRRTG